MRQEDLTYFESKEFKEALQQYESALDEGRQVYMDADEMTDIAEYYMVNQREEEAIECIKIARKLHPDAVDPQVFLARQHLFHNRLNKARQIANQIQDQDDREVLFLRQEIFIKEDRIEESHIFMMDRLKDMDEERDHFMYDTAGVFADYNLWEETYEWIQLLLAEYPDYERAQMLLCEALINLGRAEEAVPVLEKEVDAHPFDTQAWYLLSQAYLGTEQIDDALEALEYLLAIDEHHADGQLFRANCLMMRDYYTEAHEQYLHYFERHPNDPAALYADAGVLLTLVRYEEACDTIERAMQLARKQGADLYPFRVVYSNALSRLGRADEALKQLNLAELEERSIITTTEDGDIIDEAPWDNHYDYPRLRAFILLDSNQMDKALPLLAQLVAERPKDYQRILAIAIYLLDHDLVDLARDLFDHVLRVGGDTYLPECAPYLAYCAYCMHDKDTLLLRMQQAIDCNPQTTRLLFQDIFTGLSIDLYMDEVQKLWK